MVRKFRFILSITFALVTSSGADDEITLDCYLPGGVLGKCVPFNECDNIYKDNLSLYSENAEPIACSENNVCCRQFHTHIAKKVCRKYVEDLLPTEPQIKIQIYNGESVEVGDFPHMVALGVVSGIKIDFLCGGTLISSRFILTAAHCDIRRELHARLGVTDIDDIYDKNIDFLVEKIIKHPKHDRRRSENDIALLRLAEEIELEANLIYPACLNTEPEDPKTEMLIAGWGKLDGKLQGLRSSSMLKASVTATPAKECAEDLNRPEPFPIEGQICAQNQINLADTCEGDSGGPMKVSIGNGIYSLYKVIGVTSFGKTCGSGNPGVYTRVSFYLDWIVKTVWPEESLDVNQSV